MGLTLSQKDPAEHSRFFPQALLCGFSKLQLQTQATAQVGKSHSGRTRAQILLGPVLGPVLDEFTVNMRSKS